MTRSGKGVAFGELATPRHRNPAILLHVQLLGENLFNPEHMYLLSQQSLFRLGALVIHMTAFSSERGAREDVIENDDVVHALSDGQRSETPDADPATTPDPSGFGILYVEDNPALIRLLKEAFAEIKAPVRLDGVQTGRAAIAALAGDRGPASTARPNFVLLNLDLGEMSGFDVLEQMHDRSALKSIPVVVFTDSRARVDVERAFECGATAYVQKPADFEALVAFARQAVDVLSSSPTAGETDA